MPVYEHGPWDVAATRDSELGAPETRAIVAEATSRHWKAWFDQPIPALEGMTPRAAARTEEGRELLNALLADYDRKALRLPDNPANPDTTALRGGLGMDQNVRRHSTQGIHPPE